MDQTKEARRSSTTMAASNGVTKRRQRISENSRGQMHHEVAAVRDRPEKKQRDPESLNRSKRRRSERFTSRNERDVEEGSSDDDDAQHDYHRKSFRIPRLAASLKVADEMIGVPVPRKARSACIKRSYDCRTSSGSGGGGFGEDRLRPPASPRSYSFEVVSPSSSSVSVKQKQNVNGSKSRIPKPPKSSGTIVDDLEIEIAEVLSGLKKQPHSSKREDDSENSLKSSDVKGPKKLKTEGDDSSAGVEIGGLITCKARVETGHSANIDTSTIGSKTTSVVSDNQKEKELRQETLSILDGVLEKQRLDSLDSAVSKGVSEGPKLESNRDESNCSSKLEIDLMVPPTMPSSPQRVSDSIVTKDYCKQDSYAKSKEKIIVKNETTSEEVKEQKVEKREWLNLDLERPSQPQQAKSVSAQQGSVLPLPVAVGGWLSGLPPQGYVPLLKNDKAADGSNGSSTLVPSAPRPKRCATHFLIAQNIQLHQHLVKTNHLSTPNKGSAHLKGGDLRPPAENPSSQGSSPILSLNPQAQDRIAVNISALKDKASESGHFASTRPKKPQPPRACSSTVPAQASIFPTNHHLQPVMVPSKSPHPTKNPCVASGKEASSPYFTVLPNNAYSFQLSSTIRNGNPSQALPFFNGSYYSPQMFQPHQLLQKQSQPQKETKTASCSSSSHRQPQPQVNMNSLSSRANVQKHRQQSQKSEAKAAGDNSYGQIMMQPQNFSMSFASANLNFSSNGYHIVSAPPFVHQKNHQASDSKTGGGTSSSNAEDPKKTLTGMMNGQTLVFDNPSRTLNFVSDTWPPSADPSVFTHHPTQRHVTSSLTSCNSMQFQSQQQIRTHGQTQISFAAPSKSQPSQGRSSGSAPHGKVANSKTTNNKALPLSSVPSSAAQVQDQTDNSASGSTQKTSPVCGRNVPPIITSCPGHVSELKY